MPGASNTYDWILDHNTHIATSLRGSRTIPHLLHHR